MKPISPTMHGVLDYGTAGLFFALPRLLNWQGQARNLLTGAALGSVAYSLLTDYDLGVVRLLPMPAHLAVDGLLDATLFGGAALLGDEEPSVRPALLALGLAGLTITLLTRTSADAA